MKQHSRLCRAGLGRDLALPLLLLSNACVILPTMRPGRTTVFLHRGLPCRAEVFDEGESPHQFTPMSGAHPSMHRMSVRMTSSDGALIRVTVFQLNARLQRSSMIFCVMHG